MTKAPTLPGAAAPSAASIPGEVYQLGRHRLVCGDSTDPDVISRRWAETVHGEGCDWRDLDRKSVV